jgi:hypothetical protein
LTGSLPNAWIPKPENSSYRYEELEFSNSEYRVTGHCDGVLVWSENDVEILELKTISKWGWDKVNPESLGQPKPEHVIQVNAYMWLSGLNRARIVYINKDLTLKMNDGICEHIVERNEDTVAYIKRLLRECINASDLILNDSFESIYPRLPDCKTRRSKRAKTCSACNNCFDIKR